MVSTAVGAVLGAIGTFATGLLIATLWIWRHVEKLDEESYRRRIQELESEYWSEVSNSLTDLHLEITQYINEHDEIAEGDDAHPESEVILDIIEEKVDPDDLKDVVTDLRKVGEADRAYEDYKSQYEYCYRNLGLW